MAEIDLVRSEIQEQVDRLIDGRPEEPFGLYVLGPDEPGAEVARWVERTVFKEAFGDTPGLLRDEYGPYEAASRFFCVIDHRRREPAGMIRVIEPSPAGLKSLVDLSSHWGCSADDLLRRGGPELDIGRTWDLATVAVLPAYRGRAALGLVTLALFQGIGTASQLEGITYAAAILDVVVLRHMQASFKRPFSTYPGLEPAPYLGSPLSIPVWSDVEAWRRRTQASHPELHDIVFRASGLAAAVRTPIRWVEPEARQAGVRAG